VSSLPEFSGRNLVEFMPCGCWSAVQVVYADLRAQAPRTAEFMRQAARDGASRVVEMTHEEWCALRNGVNGDLMSGCDHQPQWGGVESTHDVCPRCWKQVRKRKDGGLYAHKDGWLTCSQVPFRAAGAS
jgi:hypothetical protein